MTVSHVQSKSWPINVRMLHNLWKIRHIADVNFFLLDFQRSLLLTTTMAVSVGRCWVFSSIDFLSLPCSVNLALVLHRVLQRRPKAVPTRRQLRQRQGTVVLLKHLRHLLQEHPHQRVSLECLGRWQRT